MTFPFSFFFCRSRNNCKKEKVVALFEIKISIEIKKEKKGNYNLQNDN